MSNLYPNPQRPYWLEAYYGPGGRKGTKKRPNLGRFGEREGDLCMRIEYASEQMRDMEKKIFEEREDIGSIIVGQYP